MAALKLGVVHQPAIGEVHIGDAYAVIEGDGFFVAAVADGLGHGVEAEEAAKKAMTVIKAHPELAPQMLLERTHEALKGTRGAVVAIARVELATHTLTYAGLGNIESRLVAEDKVRRPVSVNGIVGHQARKFRQEAFPFQPGDLLIMHSDGISDRFEVSTHARARDPQMLANQIAQAHGRSHDDQLLLILRQEP